MQTGVNSSDFKNLTPPLEGRSSIGVLAFERLVYCIKKAQYYISTIYDLKNYPWRRVNRF